MSIIARIERHEKLMNRMAARAGTDLDLALQTGAINPGEVRAAVLSCTGCTAPDDCKARLDNGTKGLPDYCRNAEMITSLARLLDCGD